MAVAERTATIPTGVPTLGTVDIPAFGPRQDPAVFRPVSDALALIAGLILVASGPLNGAYAVAALVFLGALGTHRRRLALSGLAETPRLVVATALPLVGFGLLAPFVSLPPSLLGQAAVTAGAVVVGRTLVYSGVRTVRRRGWFQERAIVVGAGSVGIELCHLLDAHPEYGLVPVGIVDDVPAEPDLALLGSIDDLEAIVQAYRARRILVAFGPTGEQDLIATFRSTAMLDVDLHVVPRLFELGLAPTGPDVDQIWGIPLYRIRRAALRSGSYRTKRVVDVVVGGALLLLTLPVIAVVAAAVRLSSPGPVLFRQRRIGQHGTEIEVLKFRTLTENLDADITWDVKDDPRLTPVGRWLRRLSLDELPQLWNVVRGDMSLVGPRPERPHFVSRFASQYRGYGDRHRLPAGLTGLAQVHGLRGDTSIAERARFDNYYIEHWSPWEDTKVLVLTVLAVLRDALPSAGSR